MRHQKFFRVSSVRLSRRLLQVLVILEDLLEFRRRRIATYKGSLALLSVLLDLHLLEGMVRQSELIPEAL